jgi:hypothetical protein
MPSSTLLVILWGVSCARDSEQKNGVATDKRVPKTIDEMCKCLMISIPTRID